MRMLTQRRFTSGVVALALVSLFLIGANAGRILVVNSPQRSDVIVVLAGETDRRPRRGLELLRKDYGRRLLIDVPASAMIYNQTQVQLAEDYAGSLPEAAEIGVCPIIGQSTRDESHDVERCLQHEQGTRILVVTSDFHTRRALSTFEHEIRGKTFSVAAAYDETEFGTDWWKRRQWAKTCLDEWLRLAWWNYVDRWR